MRIKSLAQGENILILRFEPATFVSKIDILTTTPIVHNWIKVFLKLPFAVSFSVLYIYVYIMFVEILLILFYIYIYICYEILCIYIDFIYNSNF